MFCIPTVAFPEQISYLAQCGAFHSHGQPTVAKTTGRLRHDVVFAENVEEFYVKAKIVSHAPCQSVLRSAGQSGGVSKF